MGPHEAVSDMRVLFLNRYFHPDHSATSQLTTDLAVGLAARGIDVTVITSGQLYDNPRAQLPREEVHQQVRIVRARTTHFGRGTLPGRALDYLSYYLCASWALWRRAGPDTVVVAMTDPPLLGVPAAWICRRRRAALVQWLQDVFPEVAAKMGVIRNRWLLRRLQRLRDDSLRASAAVVVIGDRMAEHLRAQCGVRAAVIPNWAIAETAEISGQTSALRADWGLAGRFVVGYSGNLGRVHRLGELIEAAALLRDVPVLRLLLVGEGMQHAALMAQAQSHGLHNVCFEPHQPRDRLPASLRVPDIHVVSLDESLEGLIVPSKFVGVIAMGRPVLWIGDPDGEIGTLVRESGCGVTVRPGNPAALADALRVLVADFQSGAPALQRMAERAQQLWQARFQKSAALREWETQLRRIAQQ